MWSRENELEPRSPARGVSEQTRQLVVGLSDPDDLGGVGILGQLLGEGVLVRRD